jgi:hypothetical protein
MTATEVQAATGWGFPAPDRGAYAWPATTAQIGALHREFSRLGFGEADRDTRLDAAASLVGWHFARPRRGPRALAGPRLNVS